MCDKFGHYVEEGWHTKGKGKGKQKVEDQEANVAHEDSDSNIVLLMVTTTDHLFSLFYHDERFIMIS